MEVLGQPVYTVLTFPLPELCLWVNSAAERTSSHVLVFLLAVEVHFWSGQVLTLSFLDGVTVEKESRNGLLSES